MDLDSDLDDDTRQLLERHRFDRALFGQLRERMLSGALSAAQNRLTDPIGLPTADDIQPLPELGAAERDGQHARGMAALKAGEVGCVVLAGGMATRFGGVVKAAAEALPGHSFLALKLADIREAARAAGARVPVLLMSSFATHEALVEMARAESTDEVPIEVFSQFISLRLTPEGELFRAADGALSPYAPGHGDMSFALRASGALARFRELGGKTLCMSNVDNLGAVLEPAVVGAHLASGKQMTIEVVPRRPGEPGGAPARYQGRLQIVEDFRFPEGFDLDSIPYFNTNTFVLDAEAVDRDFPLTWFLVRKTVGGLPAIQFEHLVGEVSAFLDCVCLEVRRDDEQGRFQPVKDPDELALRRPQIEAILRARGVL